MPRILLYLLLFGTVLVSTSAGAGKILVFGDSLSAAYGMPAEQGWVMLLRERLKQKGLDYQVINRSVSGETTAGGRTRLPAILAAEKPDFLVLALGANDGLRGINPRETRANLKFMIGAAETSGAGVLLVGMRLPPNYGRRYAERFHSLYTGLAEETRIALVPFLLDGVARDLRHMQADGLHPKADAQPRVLDNVWRVLEKQLDGQ